MGDKPSVEAKSLQSDIDESGLCTFIPVSPKEVPVTADIADTSLSDGMLNGFDDDRGAVTHVVVNGIRRNSDSNASSFTGAMSSPKLLHMKQSKSAHHNVNGDTSSVVCQDAKRSSSVEAKLAVTAEADNVAVDNCESSGHSEAVEPSSPSSSSTVTVVSVVHTDNEGKRQKSGRSPHLLAT